MSELLDNLADIVDDRAPGTSCLVVNLATGDKFNAEIEMVQDIEINDALGRDSRESVLMHVRNRISASKLNIGGIVQIPLLGRNEKFAILRRTDNPADPQIEFGLMKQTDKDQQ